MSRRIRFSTFAMVAASFAAYCLLFACSPENDKSVKGNETSSRSASEGPEAADRLTRIRAARANLVRFYMRTFPALIKSGYYDKELQITRPDHYAHRMWVREVDSTLDETLKTLEKLAIEKDVQSPQPSKEAPAKIVRIAYFKDENQLHRDHYAMYLGESGRKALGKIPISEFVAGAQLDYGVKSLSKRNDLAWTATLLATHVPPGGAWLNSGGQQVDVPRVLQDMLGLATPKGAEFGCYDYHVDYALGAAVRAGYSDFQDAALAHLRKDISQAKETCEVSTKRGDAMPEIILRLKLNGHLLEAILRGGDKVFPLSEFGADVDRIVDEIKKDSERIGNLKVYQGPPDIFTVVPHAIHGCDLGLMRFGPKKD